MVEFKKGFSIAEALVSATILAVVLVLALKTNTTKVKEPENTGYFKCSCENGADNLGEYQSFYVINNEIHDRKTGGSNCTFYPAEGIDFYTVNVWNSNSQVYNTKERGYTYALTSIPKRGASIVLGNAKRPDIYIEGILHIGDIVTGVCINPAFNTKETCEANEALGGNPGYWFNERCVDKVNETKADCTSAGLTWIDNTGDNNCTKGVNMEITW